MIRLCCASVGGFFFFKVTKGLTPHWRGTSCLCECSPGGVALSCMNVAKSISELPPHVSARKHRRQLHSYINRKPLTRVPYISALSSPISSSPMLESLFPPSVSPSRTACRMRTCWLAQGRNRTRWARARAREAAVCHSLESSQGGVLLPREQAVVTDAPQNQICCVRISP